MDLSNLTGFQWDRGNKDKNEIKHHVKWYECEEIFFNEPLIIAKDEHHSQEEDRYYALGRTNFNRLLFTVFTMRDSKIRIISARDMTRKEIEYYEEI